MWQQLKTLRRDKKVLVLLAVELLCLLVVFCSACRLQQPLAWQGSELLAQDQPGTVQGTDLLLQGNEQGDVIAATPDMTLKSGIYVVTVDYEGAAVLAFNAPAVRAGVVELPPSGPLSFTAYVNTTQHGVRLQVMGAKAEPFVLRSVSIAPTMAWSRVQLLSLLALFLALDAAWLFYTRRLRPAGGDAALLAGTAVVGIALLASAPLLIEGTIAGHDLPFHLTRIEAIAAGLRGGVFPVKINDVWLGGRGYAASVFYGDLFLYFPAILRLIGFSLQQAYLCYGVAVHLATAVLCYGCLYRMVGRRSAALTGTLLYVLCAYRLTNVYTRGAVGEYTAMVFWPLVFYGVWRILTLEKDQTPPPLVWLPAALGYAGLVMTHVLSCEMAAVLTLGYCLVYLRRVLRKNTFWPLVKVVAAALGLCLWFLLPLVDYASQGKYLFMWEWTHKLQTLGAMPGQLLELFGGAQNGMVSDYATTPIANHMPLTVGTTLLLGAVLFLVANYLRGKNGTHLARLGMAALAGGVLCLWMASEHFPWDALCEQSRRLSNLVHTIQYPWRFLSPAAFLLAVCTACGVALLAQGSLRRHLATACTILAVLALVSWGEFVHSAYQGLRQSFLYSTANLGFCSVVGGEYLPIETDLGVLYDTRSVKAADTVTLHQSSYGSLRVEVQAKTEAGGDVTVPLLYYPYYRAQDLASGQMLPVAMEEGGEIAVTLPANYNGTFAVYYKEPWHWRLAEAFSLCVAAGIALQWYRLRPKRATKQRRKPA